MILNLDKYRVNIPSIKALTEGKTPEERLELISRIASASHCPVIAVACFVVELYGSTPGLETKIERLTAWYTLNGVTGRRFKA